MGNFIKRTTKMSVFTVFLCIMLFSVSAFAWYSISASASVNTVESGTLDVSLEMFESGNWVDAEGKTLNFCDKSDSTKVYWEPGCTYELPTLRIANNGNIAFEYTVEISGINGSDKLNEVIEWSYVTGGTASELTTISGELAPGETAAEFTIRGHMKEDASNEYQGLSIKGIAINVTANQIKTSNVIECNGEPYYNIFTDTDLEIDENGAYIILNDNEQNILASVSGQKITLSNATYTGTTEAIMFGAYRSPAYNRYNLEANNVTLSNLNVTNGVLNGSDKISNGVYAYGDVVLNNCTMTGTTSTAEGYNVYDIGFVNKSTATINGGKYGAMYIWSQAHVTINDAEVDKIVCSAITIRNLGMLTIASGTHVGTIDLTVAGYYQYKPALTIEEGAVVDEIIYKGVTYTQDEWINNNPL